MARKNSTYINLEIILNLKYTNIFILRQYKEDG